MEEKSLRLEGMNGLAFGSGFLECILGLSMDLVLGIMYIG